MEDGRDLCLRKRLRDGWWFLVRGNSVWYKFLLFDKRSVVREGSECTVGVSLVIVVVQLSL